MKFILYPKYCSKYVNIVDNLVSSDFRCFCLSERKLRVEDCVLCSIIHFRQEKEQYYKYYKYFILLLSLNRFKILYLLLVML